MRQWKEHNKYTQEIHNRDNLWLEQLTIPQEHTFNSSSISDIFLSIARRSRFSNSDKEFLVVCKDFYLIHKLSFYL